MISIFKTNIENNSQIEKISNELDELIGSFKWNFDLEDCDKILRIDSKIDITNVTINLLHNNGFECVELED